MEITPLIFYVLCAVAFGLIILTGYGAVKFEQVASKKPADPHHNTRLLITVGVLALLGVLAGLSLGLALTS